VASRGADERPDGSPSRIIREIPLIQRYARHNEAEDFRFRAFLKGRLNLSTEQTDAVVRQTTDEVWSQIDCTQCANCCRTLQVVLDVADIRRLSARLGMTARQFGRRYVQSAEDGTQHIAAIPCPFLGQDNRCTVYEDRPKACRDFPYLHEKRFVGRTFMMIDNTAVCPIVFNVWQALKVRLGFRRSRPR
jgi:Fe-S-cluster containining protein